MRNAKGFTIVELLVVIVVIAILALIAFFNFQALRVRAIDASFQAVSNTYIKAFENYYTLNQSFPTVESTIGPYPNIQWACLGTNYTANADLPQDACAKGPIGIFAYKSPTIDAALSATLTKQQNSDISQMITSSGETYRGIFYQGGNKTMRIMYVLGGKHTCSNNAETIYLEPPDMIPAVTACRVEYTKP